MQGDGVEYFNLTLASNDQAFDKIKLIQFSKSGCNKGQIPTQGRRLATHTMTIINSAVSLNNVANSTQRREISDAALFEFVKYGRSAELSQMARVTKLFANSQNQLFHLSAGSVMNPSRCAAVIAETDAIKTLARGSVNPSFDVGWRDAKLAGDKTNRFTATNSSNYIAPPFFTLVFLLNVSTSKIGFLT